MDTWGIWASKPRIRVTRNSEGVVEEVVTGRTQTGTKAGPMVTLKLLFHLLNSCTWGPLVPPRPVPLKYWGCWTFPVDTENFNTLLNLYYSFVSWGVRTWTLRYTNPVTPSIDHDQPCESNRKGVPGPRPPSLLLLLLSIVPTPFSGVSTGTSSVSPSPVFYLLCKKKINK